MRKFTFLSVCLAVLLITAACEKPEDEITPPPVPEAGEGVVKFSLEALTAPDGLPEGTIAVTFGETEITTLDAILFSNGKLDSCISLNHVNAEYSFSAKAGGYTMILVANADTAFYRQAAQFIPGETPAYDVINQLTVGACRTEDNGLPMISEEVTFSVDEEKETNLETIQLSCPVVRIDLLSGVDGLVMESLKFTNAHTRMSLDRTLSQGESLTITDFQNTGTPENPAVNTGSVYLFPDAATEMRLSYSYDGESSEISASMGNDMSGAMIWGFMANRKTELDITEIKTTMNEGYLPVFDIPLTEFKVGGALMGEGTETSFLPDVQVEPFDYEFNVNNAWFVFLKNDMLYSFEEGERYGRNMYQTTLYESGDFKVMMIANASEDLIAELSELPTETTNLQTILSTVANQDPGTKDNFLMVTDIKDITVESVFKTNKFDTKRLSSRIDIINGVPGMTIDKIVFENHAASTTLETGEPRSEMLDTQEYTGFEGIGSMTDYPIYAGKIYTYQNNSATNPPVLTIHYSINGDSGTKEVGFEDFDGITAGKLYSVVLSGDNLDVLVQEENWATGYSPKVGNKQGIMNAALAVNHFAEFNVKSFNGSNISFCTSNNSPEEDDPQASGYFTWNEEWKTSTYTSEDGSKWKVPSIDEMQLLIPDTVYSMDFNSVKATKTTEETLPEQLFGDHKGGTGTSVFRNQKNNYSMAGCVLYALRFKGTEQYAAYRYELINCDLDADDAYLNIKIKALAPDDNTDILYIADAVNPDFWQRDVIEYNIPLSGVKFDAGSEPMTRGMSTTLWVNSNKYMMLTLRESSLMEAREGEHANIRMVRVD